MISITTVFYNYVGKIQAKDITTPKLEIDKEFNRKADFDNEKNDTSVSTSVSSIQTREITDMTKPLIMPKTHILEQYKIDVKPFINRPFFVGSVRWTTSHAKYITLTNDVECLPRDIINSNPTIKQGLKIGSLYRMAGQLSISVAGTIAHAGCVLVGIIPPLPDTINHADKQAPLVNTLLSGPHAFLHANEATSVLLDIPWYCNTDYDSLDCDDTPGYRSAITINNIPASCATLVFLVLNPLQASTGASTTLTIVIEANLTNFEVAVPTPRYVTFDNTPNYLAQSYFSNLGTSLLDSATGFAKTFVGDAIDGVRGAIRHFTGLHNPNLPQLQTSSYMIQRNRLNNVDTLQYLENLDPNANFSRVVSEPIFNTDVDEMAISHIIQKKQFVGTFRVNALDRIGILLFSRPISPFQGGLQAVTSPTGDLNTSIANNIELMHLLTRAWSGDIKITIQSVMNNKQQVKLRLLQYYNPNPKVLDQVPNYASLLQAPSHLMEFSAGGQTQEVVLPYLCRNRIMLNARESNLEALYHGMYYIYVAQPLANSPDSPQDIYFNVYISMEPGAKFYGYSTEIHKASGPWYHPDERNAPTEYKAQSYTMNKPQVQEPNSEKPPETHEDSRLMPLIDVRPLIRRLYHLKPIEDINTEAFNQHNIVLTLDSQIGEVETRSSMKESIPCSTISRMYYGKHVGLKVRLTLRCEVGDFAPDLRVYFVPPQYYPKRDNDHMLLAAGKVDEDFDAFDFANSSFPLTNIASPILTSARNERIFEFVVPNVSPLKFIGGPLKMLFLTSSTYYSTAPNDLGNLMLCIDSREDSVYTLYQEYGFTDESRLGFHCIAPVIERPVVLEASDFYITPNVGTVGSTTSPPEVILNESIYYTRR